MDNLALQIQKLGGFQDQVLVLLRLAVLRENGAPVTPATVKDIFLRLRLPPPTNVSQCLKTLRGDHFVMQPSTAAWSVTPLGEERIRILMANVSEDALQSLVKASVGEAKFGEAGHHLIPPELSPAEFEPGIARFLAGHPFETNVFAITRFPRSKSDPINHALIACKRACTGRGLELHLASDRSVDDSIPKNVAASIWASKYGIAVLEDRVGEGLNYNVIFEIGAMVATGRRCLLLKDIDAPKPPTDLIGHIYVEVDITEEAAVQDAVEKWIKETWGV